MNKKFTILYLIVFTLILVSCKSCDKQTTDSLLKKEYEIVYCILAPDTGQSFVRTYSTEVFVGKIIPTDINNNYIISGMKDTVLNELMVCTRQHFIAYYDYDADAEVYIEGNGQSIKLSYIDKGIYRDVNNDLKIEANKKYKLIVNKSNGKYYSSETIIPDNIEIININTDTLSFKPIENRKAVFDIKTFSANKPFYYVERDRRNNMSSDIILYSFDSCFSKAVIFYKSETDTSHIEYVTIKDEIRAINSNFGQFLEPCGTIGMTESFWSWNASHNKIGIMERSNIQGDGVVGVFGAYNATVKNYVVRALWDSVTSKK